MPRGPRSGRTRERRIVWRVTSPNWIELDGAVNVRDVGGLPTRFGDQVRPRRLIRSDNLQALSSRDVRMLVDEFGVTTVVDLRKGQELRLEGEGPMHAEPAVTILHHSIYPDAPAREGEPDRISWETVGDADHDNPWTAHYLTYLTMRPDSVLAALRAVAYAPGAAIVHCAAGKDRTGTIVSLALQLADVTDEAIVADYAASGERVEAILAHLRRRDAYAMNLTHATVANQMTHAENMADLLAAIREIYGGAAGYLERHGWRPTDTDAMRRKLLAD